MIGSSCFALGTVPVYVHAVGAQADAVTFFVGSVFFTSASFCQLVQAQSSTMTNVADDLQHRRAPITLLAWRPKDRNWMAAATQFPGTLFFNVSTFAATAHNLSVPESDRYVWRPDFFGSVLFLVSSAYAILALGDGFLSRRLRSLPWWIAWLNMLGSIAFMVSAIASFVLPSTGGVIDEPVANAGTFVGAVCFLIGAALILPAWRGAVRSVTHTATTQRDRR
ncbi:MAG: hypothetical protein ABWY57_05655 [Mycetocola sp.]